MQKYVYNGCVMAALATDSGLPDVLLPNATVTAYENHPYVKRLVARGLLEQDEASGCTPTTLKFVPKVILPAGKSRIILRAVLEINGRLVFNYNGNVGFADIEYNPLPIATPQQIAKELFLMSGIDLMRQMRAEDHFDFQPYVGTFEDIPAGSPIIITGREKNADSVEGGYVKFIPQSVNLTLKVIDNLPADAVDFVATQWGHDVSVHSCMSIINIGV